MEILYQDRRIVAAVKPAGVLSTDESGGMPTLLREALGTECILSVHRLDAATGGVMVYARSHKAASLLSASIAGRAFRKEYLAIVHSAPSPAAGTLWDLLGRDRQRRITYIAAEPGPEVREAELDYTVLASRSGTSLVRIRLHTGRTHQIRVQFSGRGWPLVGDRKYGIPDGADALALWSFRLELPHPESGEILSFTALPSGGSWEAYRDVLENI